MSNGNGNILDIIQYKTGKSLEVIAAEIGYSRPHLNKAKLSGEIGKKMMNKLQEVYAEILQNVPRENQTNDYKKTSPSITESELMKRLDVLINSNKELAHAQLLMAETTKAMAASNLLLAQKISSSKHDSGSGPSQAEDKEQAPFEELPLGRGSRSSGKTVSKLRGT